MPKTSLTVLFGRNAITIRGDSTVTVNSGGEQSFGLASNLEGEGLDIKFASYEPDYWVLDGSYKFASNDMQTGYVSANQSGAAGAFSPVAPPELEFIFGAEYNTVAGLTLYFSEETGNYCSQVTIEYLDDTSTQIRADTYNPTSTTFSTGQAVSGFKTIIITLEETNEPYRFARLVAVDFDTITRWTGGNIKQGRLVEQISPLGLELPSNEIEFTLYSADGDFSIISPAGEYAALQENEPIEAYEQVGNEMIFLGRFYLDEWESLSDREARFVALDAIPFLDAPTFYLENLSAYEYSQTLIGYIMDTAGLEFEIDASLENIDTAGVYNGIFPIMSCRNALANVLTSIGGYASCARSRVIRILPFELASDLTTYDHRLDATVKSVKSNVTLRKLVTDVNVNAYVFQRVYFSDEGFSEKYFVDRAFTNGTYIVTWDQFVYWYVGGTATWTATREGRNWADITVTAPGTVVMQSQYYFRPTTVLTSIVNGTVPAGTPKNSINILDDARITSTLGPIVAQRVYDYYLQRHVQKTKLFGMSVAVGDSVLSDAQGAQIKGIVERAEYNLTGGFIADVEIIGTVAA